MVPKYSQVTASKLCCLLAPKVVCKECREQWCEACWFPLKKGDPSNRTTHTRGTKYKGGWGKCPKVDQYVKWSVMEGDESTLCIAPYEGHQIT